MLVPLLPAAALPPVLSCKTHTQAAAGGDEAAAAAAAVAGCDVAEAAAAAAPSSSEQLKFIDTLRPMDRPPALHPEPLLQGQAARTVWMWLPADATSNWHGHMAIVQAGSLLHTNGRAIIACMRRLAGSRCLSGKLQIAHSKQRGGYEQASERATAATAEAAAAEVATAAGASTAADVHLFAALVSVQQLAAEHSSEHSGGCVSIPSDATSKGRPRLQVYEQGTLGLGHHTHGPRGSSPYANGHNTASWNDAVLEWDLDVALHCPAVAASSWLFGLQRCAETTQAAVQARGHSWAGEWVVSGVSACLTTLQGQGAVSTPSGACLTHGTHWRDRLVQQGLLSVLFRVSVMRRLCLIEHAQERPWHWTCFLNFHLPLPAPAPPATRPCRDAE